MHNPEKKQSTLESEKKELILEFLKKHTLAVIATSHADGSPEAAVIDFSVRDNLEIVFDTFKETRKYSNLQRQSKVAFVVGWDRNVTVQYEGDGIEVSAPEVEEYQKEHIAKVPFEKQFIERGARMFKVVPRWIRYSDFSKEPSDFVELEF